MSFDTIIENGLCFDGTGKPGERVNIGIRDGRIAAWSAEPLDETGCKYLRREEPALWAVLARVVTVTPAKTAIKVSA